MAPNNNGQRVVRTWQEPRGGTGETILELEGGSQWRTGTGIAHERGTGQRVGLVDIGHNWHWVVR